MTADTITAIKKALEDLNALVAMVAEDTGALVMSDPDEDSVGSTLEGDLEMTFGHVRRAHAALAALQAALSTDAEPVAFKTPHFEKNINGKLVPIIVPIESASKPKLDWNWTPLYDRPQQPAPSVSVKALQAIANYRHHSRLDSEENAEAMERIARSALSAQVQDVATHRHKKRGSEYALIGVGKMQAENWCEFTTDVNHTDGRLYAIAGKSVDMREVSIYRSVDGGSLWVRPVEEFNDGRFEQLGQSSSYREGKELSLQNRFGPINGIDRLTETQIDTMLAAAPAAKLEEKP